MSANPQTLIKTDDPRIQVATAQSKPVDNVKVELQRVRRELLTLASRVEKLVQSQETA